MKTIIRFLHNISNACLGNALQSPPLYPHDLLMDWLLEAHTCGCQEPEAMKISTYGLRGYPECRTVLFKGFHQDEPECDNRMFPETTYLTFYSNYDSNKGLEIKSNKHVALTFYWPELYREVRITGDAIRAPHNISSEYWQSRPWRSKVASLVSKQSKPISSRKELLFNISAAEAQLFGHYVPRPENWGGYLVYPIAYEFFQGKANRINERLKYSFDPHDGKIWHTEILQP